MCIAISNPDDPRYACDCHLEPDPAFCADCGRPFNNADAPLDGLCLGCRA